MIPIVNIGEVSARLNIPASTIRYYEKVGLIEQQGRQSGRRQFNEQALYTLQFVQLAQAAGFTIAETKALLQSYHADGSANGLWNPMAKSKRLSIREQIEKLEYMDGILEKLIQCRCKSLKSCVLAAAKSRKQNDQKRCGLHASK